MTMLDVLWATRRQLDDPKHWWKGRSEKRRDETCVALGLMEAAELLCDRDRVDADLRAAEAAVARAADLVHVPTVSLLAVLTVLTRWNDHPHTTHAEVLAALDKAIDAEKSREAA